VTLDVEPVHADVDPTRIEQVLGNLLENALRYTPPGGSVRVAVRPLGEEVLLEVEDSGIGIAAELLPRIFDLLVQGERPVDRQLGGLGIGLTLVQRLAVLHGGRVEAHSEGPGRGTRFRVILPRLSAAPPPDPPRRTPALPGARRRVLVIEDNTDTWEMLTLLLELQGHEVHTAADGPSGIATATRVRPDVALVDLGLPGVDGYEVARRIAPTGTRLVALTGYGADEDRIRALAAGFHMHLVKPVTAEQLRAALELR
jgi:CheY-like chemotaxis protein